MLKILKMAEYLVRMRIKTTCLKYVNKRNVIKTKATDHLHFLTVSVRLEGGGHTVRKLY